MNQPRIDWRLNGTHSRPVVSEGSMELAKAGPIHTHRRLANATHTHTRDLGGTVPECR